MQNCWHEDPKKRPAFSEISKTLFSILAGMHRQSLRPQQKQQQGQQHYRYDQYQVTPGNGGGGFWNKIHKPKKQQQHPATIFGSLDATSLSDQAGFWPRLQSIRASGMLDESWADKDYHQHYAYSPTLLERRNEEMHPSILKKHHWVLSNTYVQFDYLCYRGSLLC